NGSLRQEVGDESVRAPGAQREERPLEPLPQLAQARDTLRAELSARRSGPVGHFAEVPEERAGAQADSKAQGRTPARMARPEPKEAEGVLGRYGTADRLGATREQGSAKKELSEEMAKRSSRAPSYANPQSAAAAPQPAPAPPGAVPATAPVTPTS